MMLLSPLRRWQGLQRGLVLLSSLRLRWQELQRGRTAATGIVADDTCCGVSGDDGTRDAHTGAVGSPLGGGGGGHSWSRQGWLQSTGAGPSVSRQAWRRARLRAWSKRVEFAKRCAVPEHADVGVGFGAGRARPLCENVEEHSGKWLRTDGVELWGTSAGWLLAWWSCSGVLHLSAGSGCRRRGRAHFRSLYSFRHWWPDRANSRADAGLTTGSLACRLLRQAAVIWGLYCWYTLVSEGSWLPSARMHGGLQSTCAGSSVSRQARRWARLRAWSKRSRVCQAVLWSGA